MHEMKSASMKRFCIILSSILSIICSLTSCATQPGTPSATANSFVEETCSPVSEAAQQSDRSLTLTLIESDRSTIFSCDDLGGNFTEGLTYRNVQDVCICINAETLALEEALQNGEISEADILCLARMDAKAGICQASCKSIYGLTNFFYSYPEYVVRLIYDIFETPDGQQHLISNMAIFPSGTTPPTVKVFSDGENSIIRYDQEDWGLSFEELVVTPNDITLKISQKGGQQIGQLNIRDYFLGSNDQALSRLDGSSEVIYINEPVNMGSTTQLTIDWSESFGELPSGRYQLSLTIQDVYEESQVHPLMLNYYDYWTYLIEFEIP